MANCQSPAPASSVSLCSTRGALSSCRTWLGGCQARPEGSKFERPVGHELHARGRYEKVLLQAYAGVQLWVIETRLDGDKVTLRQYIFPTWIQVWTFLRRKPHAVAEMVVEDSRQ